MPKDTTKGRACQQHHIGGGWCEINQATLWLTDRGKRVILKKKGGGFMWVVIFLVLLVIGVSMLAGGQRMRKMRMGSGEIETIVLKRGENARLVGILLVALAFVVLLLSCVRMIGPGEVGVKVLFGRVLEDPLPSGLHLVNPFISVQKMSIRTQEYTMSKRRGEGTIRGDDAISALTSEGLAIELDVTVWYHLEPSLAWKVYRDIGLNYVGKIVRPAIRTAIRNAAALYSVNDIYSANREKVAEYIFEELKEDLEPKGITVEDVLLRNVNLPERVRRAIDEKIAAEQEAQKMKYVLQREEQEAKRKEVEAKGIARAQKIIANSLSRNYLQWYYIQTLKEMVNSPNNTVIVMPFDQNLTPLLQVPSGGSR